MKRREVSPGHRAAMVAVVGLVAGFLGVAAADGNSKSKTPSAGNGPADGGPTCHAWAEVTRRGIEKVGENACRNFIIGSLAQACSAVPKPLRRAAAQVQRVKDPSERARILATAASSTLGEGCAVAEPLGDARRVASTCPLPSLPPNFPFGQGEAELEDLRAVDYLILDALLRSLLAANQFDESAQRVVLDFALSAQINGEDFRKRHECPKRRSQ